MIVHYYDTSALAKHYQIEPGTPVVDELLVTSGCRNLISRLALVEFHSTLAKKVRNAELTTGDFQRLARRFEDDVTAKRVEVVSVLVSHFRAAEQLVRRLGLTKNLRTLDALQLAVALNLNEQESPITFISADQALCAIAAGEGLKVVNPEIP